MLREEVPFVVVILREEQGGGGPSVPAAPAAAPVPGGVVEGTLRVLVGK